MSYGHKAGEKRDDHLPETFVLLPEILRDAGYSTLAVTAGGYMSEFFGFSREFDLFSDTPEGIAKGCELLLAQIKRALRSDDSIFAFLHTYEVHSPYSPPAEFGTLFGDYESDIEPTSEVLQPIQNDARSSLTEQDLEFLKVAYDREIRHTDESLRHFFAGLEEIGFLENAFVVITSDHGEEFGEHGGLLHRVSLYDELLRIPLIVFGVGSQTGVVNSRIVSTLDLAPTILVAAGLEPSPSMEGRDILALDADLPAGGIEGVGPEADVVFSQYSHILYSVRTHRWKLIDDRRRKRVELFDLKADPREQINLASSLPEIRDSLLVKIREWRAGQEEFQSPDVTLSPLPKELERQLEALGYFD